MLVVYLILAKVLSLEYKFFDTKTLVTVGKIVQVFLKNIVKQAQVNNSTYLV